MAASGAFIAFFNVFFPNTLYRYPFSSIVVIGFAVTLQLGPLFFTAIEKNSLTYNLNMPLNTFSHALLAIICCVVAHHLYRRSKMLRRFRLRLQSVMLNVGVFRPLNIREVIFMGALGVASFGILPFVGDLRASVFIKFIEGIRFFAVIPSAYLLQVLTEDNSIDCTARDFKRQSAFLIFFVFTILNLIAGLLRNTRSNFIVPVVCFVICYILYWLCGLVRIRLSALLAALLSFFLIFPYLVDLSTAIVMTRGFRANVSPVVLMQETLLQMDDRAAIRSYRQLMASIDTSSDSWNESYVDNLFLARFANAKFPDNSIFYESLLTEKQRSEMQNHTYHEAVSILPSPVLNLFDLDLIKSEAQKSSMGDKMYSLASGNSYALGSFRTGHFFGVAFSVFGWFYLPLLVLSLVFIFPFIDSHALSEFGFQLAPPVISSLAISLLYFWFTLSNKESLIGLLSFPLREYFETILLFTVSRRAIRIIAFR